VAFSETANCDKTLVSISVDRGTVYRYVISAKAAYESTIRLLLADRQQEPMTVYIIGFRADESLKWDDTFDHDYADNGAHVNTCTGPRGTDTTAALASLRHLQREIDKISQKGPITSAVVNRQTLLDFMF